MTTDINQQKSEDKAQMLECALPAGTVLRGKSGREYKITEVLGAGGFGITYKAVGKVVINKETNYSQMATFAIKEFSCGVVHATQAEQMYFVRQACGATWRQANATSGKRPKYW